MPEDEAPHIVSPDGKRSRRRPSPAFLAALGGLAITTYAWFSSSVWPAWPGLAVFPLVSDYLDPSSNFREAALVLLIVVNVSVWAVMFLFAAALIRRFHRPRR